MPNLPDAAQVAYMEAHASDTLVPNIIAACCVCGIASTAAVGLRFLSRRLTHMSLQISDWCILFAWVNYAVFTISFAMTTRYGGGRHIILVTNARMLQILNIVDENVYCICMAFIKFSILSFYGTIFPQRWFRQTLVGLAVFMGGWAISACIAGIFQCTPIAYGWDPTIPGGHCIDYGVVVLVIGICNIVTDFIILGLPVPLIWQLKISQQKKWMLLFTFFFGGSACIVSIARLAYTYVVGSTSDGSWDNIPAGLLSAAELMVGIFAVSVPTYRPLWKRIFHGSATAGSKKRSRAHEYHRYGSSGGGSPGDRSVKIFAGEPPHAGSVEGRVGVTEEIDMVTHANKGGIWVRVPSEDETRLYSSQKAYVPAAGMHSQGAYVPSPYAPPTYTQEPAYGQDAYAQATHPQRTYQGSSDESRSFA